MAARVQVATARPARASAGSAARRHNPNALPLGLWIALWVGVVFYTLLAAFPYLVMLSTMVKSDAEMNEATHWLPRGFDLSAVSSVLTSDATWAYLRNSFIIAVGSTLIVMIAGVPAAYTIARHEFRGRKPFLDLILITQMFSPVVLLIPLFRLYNELGLLGTLQGVIIAGSAFTLPFAVWLMTGFFRAIPVEIEEAARVDGYGRFSILWRIVLPLAVPGLVATALYAFIIGWNEFIFAVTFLPGTPENQPISVGVFMNIGKWNIAWQRLMAMALFGTLPVLIIFATIQRQLDRGFAAIASGQ